MLNLKIGENDKIATESYKTGNLTHYTNCFKQDVTAG